MNLFVSAKESVDVLDFCPMDYYVWGSRCSGCSGDHVKCSCIPFIDGVEQRYSKPDCSKFDTKDQKSVCDYTGPYKWWLEANPELAKNERISGGRGGGGPTQ